MAIERISPRKPKIRDPTANVAGATTNLISIENAVSVHPQSIIFGCNAMNNPASIKDLILESALNRPKRF
ncbi:hypothetical protein Hanom_Chr12g01179371 [Helianthus anomalus]